MNIFISEIPFIWLRVSAQCTQSSVHSHYISVALHSPFLSFKSFGYPLWADVYEHGPSFDFQPQDKTAEWKAKEDDQVWSEWLEKYKTRLMKEVSGAEDVEAANQRRLDTMNSSNPKWDTVPVVKLHYDSLVDSIFSANS